MVSGKTVIDADGRHGKRMIKNLDQNWRQEKKLCSETKESGLETKLDTHRSSLSTAAATVSCRLFKHQLIDETKKLIEIKLLPIGQSFKNVHGYSVECASYLSPKGPQLVHSGSHKGTNLDRVQTIADMTIRMGNQLRLEAQ